MRISDWSSDVCSSDLETRFTASCTPFRHLGFFPDMAPVWDWLRDRVADKAEPAFLNLFGYTGVGSQALAAAGASVTHVDASKKSVGQARERSEEHTSELQSLMRISYAVFCLQKKKQKS